MQWQASVLLTQGRQRQHVHRQVQQAGVDQCRGDQAVDLAMEHRRGGEADGAVAVARQAQHTKHAGADGQREPSGGGSGGRCGERTAEDQRKARNAATRTE